MRFGFKMRRNGEIMSNTLKINYKIYLEAEDVAQSRILSCASYLENVLHQHKNPYICCAQTENDSSLDEFELRLYAHGEIEENECKNVDAAEAFLDEFAAVLSDTAHIHSFLQMDGSFSISFEGEKIAYEFESWPHESRCKFTEIEL